MTVRRIMGSETEFGVLAQGQPDANATVLSTRVVTGYASWVARRRSETVRAGAATHGAGPGGVVGTGWDYGSETPLADARGFTVAREDAHPSQLTDEAPVLTAEEIAAAIAPGHRDRVRYLEHADPRPSASGPFNAGMRAARTPWVSIVGSDDSLLPGAVASWLRLARAAGFTADSRGTANEALHRELKRVRRDVADLHERLFYRPLLDWVDGLAEAGLVKPAALDRLGLPQAELDRHIGWDIGIAGTTRALAGLLDAGLAVYGPDGALLGIGSLQLQQGGTAGPKTINMIVPIDLLPPILDDLTTRGRVDRPVRPWLGLYASDGEDSVVVMGLADDGPAEAADLRPGDVIVAVAGEPVADLAGFFRQVWALGEAGVRVPLTIQRDGKPLKLSVTSSDRERFLVSPQLH